MSVNLNDIVETSAFKAGECVLDNVVEEGVREDVIAVYYAMHVPSCQLVITSLNVHLFWVDPTNVVNNLLCYT